MAGLAGFGGGGFGQMRPPGQMWPQQQQMGGQLPSFGEQHQQMGQLPPMGQPQQMGQMPMQQFSPFNRPQQQQMNPWAQKIQGYANQYPDQFAQFQTWFGQRPQRSPDLRGMDYRSALTDWRGQMPSFPGMMNAFQG